MCINGGVFINMETIRIGTVTYANKAKEVLAVRGMRTKIRKSISENDGCIYLLEIEKKHLEKALNILGENGINYERGDIR